MNQTPSRLTAQFLSGSEASQEIVHTPLLWGARPQGPRVDTSN